MTKRKIRTPRSRGARQFVAVLPNGRSVWLTFSPAPAGVRELDLLAESIDQRDARLSRSLTANAHASSRLKRTLKNDATAVTRTSLRAGRRLRSRFSAGDAKLDGRFNEAVAQAKRQITTDQKEQRGLLRGLRRRALWDQLVLASAAPLMAAYGQRGDPLAVNNVVVAVALGLWLVGDDISDLVSGKGSRGTASMRGSDAWSYLAPAANLLSGWWMLRGLQHERFVTGRCVLEDFKVEPRVTSASQARVAADVSSVTGDGAAVNDTSNGLVSAPCHHWILTEHYVASVDLSSLIAPEHLRDFQGFSNVPALATIGSVGFAPQHADEPPSIELLAAEVKRGFLLITMRVSTSYGESYRRPPTSPSIFNRLEVAWAVDTKQPSPTTGAAATDDQASAS